MSLPSSPLQEIQATLLNKQGIRFLIKRDDLLHFPINDKMTENGMGPAFCGNKYRKLKRNIQEAKKEGENTLLTFGGAFSNHITATAEAGQLFGINTIGIIRGEAHLPLNPSLAYATDCGMQLHYLDRSTFRNKYAPSVLTDLQDRFGDFYMVPEGGTNALAIKGVKELISEIPEQYREATFAVSCGTGGTFAGLIEGLDGYGQAMGFSALKGDFLTQEVKNLLSQPFENWTIQTEFHFGGYAKFKPPLIDFINQFKAEHGIQLDPIYTGKLFYGLFDLIKKGFFPKGTTIIAIHTGGLQGIQGFNQRFGNLLVV